MIKGKNFEITAQNILGHEIIGLDVKVIQSSDPSREGIVGVVLNETQKTFTILGTHKNTEKKKFVVPKEECEFEFDLKGEKVIVKGKEIMKRPEDRAKEWRN